MRDESPQTRRRPCATRLANAKSSRLMHYLRHEAARRQLHRTCAPRGLARHDDRALRGAPGHSGAGVVRRAARSTPAHRHPCRVTTTFRSSSHGSVAPVGSEYGRRPHRCLQSGKRTFPAAVSFWKCAGATSGRERRKRGVHLCRYFLHATRHENGLRIQRRLQFFIGRGSFERQLRVVALAALG